MSDSESIPKAFLRYAWKDDNRLHPHRGGTWLDRLRTQLGLDEWNKALKSSSDLNILPGEARESLGELRAVPLVLNHCAPEVPFSSPNPRDPAGPPLEKRLTDFQMIRSLESPLIDQPTPKQNELSLNVAQPVRDRGKEFRTPCKVPAVPGSTSPSGPSDSRAVEAVLFSKEREPVPSVPPREPRKGDGPVRWRSPKFCRGIAVGLAWVVAIAITLGFGGKGSTGDCQAAERPKATIPPAVVSPRSPPLRQTNSLGMVFVPVAGTKVWFSVWETRVRDYEAYARKNSNVDSSWKNPTVNGVEITPGPDHPVVNVSWNDAQGFCRWLTQQDLRAGLLRRGQSYRLPTDLEWSAAVGLTNEVGATPGLRDKKVAGVYPWGTQWPPPEFVGNYRDETFRARFGDSVTIFGDSRSIPYSQDGQAVTAPVGTYPAKANGLFDLGGNVWEWCEDFYYGKKQQRMLKDRVLRGGSWDYYGPGFLLSSYRLTSAPDEREVSTGFRVVLVGDGSAR